MKILHTADWHIGQLFHDFDRTQEHEAFLSWLLSILMQQQADALLISGDVFDQANPGAHSIKLFYQFLQRATAQQPQLQIIITAGNHDSPTRLEAPKPLLENSNIHIVGTVQRDDAGAIDYDALTIPLKNSKGDIAAWCLAIPFLRVGDYPHLMDAESPYGAGVAAFYDAAAQNALTIRQPHQALIAMGHLHAQKAEITDMDAKERLIMGGVESIAASAFHPDLAYVALGHIHKAQQIGKPTIRYSGSPIPMSFTERNYKHQVVCFTLENETLSDLSFLEVPIAIPVVSVPAKHSVLTTVLQALNELPDYETPPYLEVRVLEDQPEPGLRAKIEAALEGKSVRLASINLKRIKAISNGEATTDEIIPSIESLQPIDIMTRVYTSKYNSPPPDTLVTLFNEVVNEIAANPS